MTIDHRDDLARLSSHARAPERARLRLGVGAAIVLLIAALVTAVLVSALAQPTSDRVGAGPDAASSTAGTFSQAPDAQASPAPTIFVHVLGAVRTPGLFDLPAGSRVMDVVAQAGGLLETADPGGVNLARLLVDGEQLYVPLVGESPPGQPSGAAAGGAAGLAAGPAAKVNLNTGSLSDLDTLPHVGPMMAQRIIDYRTANGRFTSVDDLRNVTGVGDKTFEALKDLVTT
ncbi:helix-hairpin-helix domain-containing protein [Cryobacterium psychrophilum]|uniref:Helix-hairpin-helix domain-containing protein n=1 Tax=Cryobacterium psychrophilum TaxID=41988 RepID=A0A4Y8KN10_9MICO|nr:helix-hairpin-helix domain-containing protein [Cryobacterium psychrophilum]TDW31525.1 competence protein ComEA [Cryobacterium psychrophilum]TFD79322.1 helix-hairpin-helix domain-containing protein [Cryobacterium psychrophilum]